MPSFFGLTVRHDDRKRLLVGQAILRSHHVEDKNYTPDGWFGEKPEKDEAWAPVDDSDFIDQFEADFCLERKREPGLSLVVPYCDTAWTVDAVIESVLQDYFYVILRDELVVTVENNLSTTVMNARTLPDIAANASESLRSVLFPLFELSQRRSTPQRRDRI